MGIRAVAIGLTCFLGVSLVPRVGHAAAGWPRPDRGTQIAARVRMLLQETEDPVQVARGLTEAGIRFIGYQALTMDVWDAGDGPVLGAVTRQSMGTDLVPTSRDLTPLTKAKAMFFGRPAGRKDDFTLRQWVYEWKEPDGTLREQAAITGAWQAPERWWKARPADVIGVEWVPQDLAYVVARPYDGVHYDQQTLGAASFTVDDSVRRWVLFVDFTPTAPSVYGKVTNIFVNYTHTYLGWSLRVILGAGKDGGTGSVMVETNGRAWTEGTGLALRIGTRDSRGPGEVKAPAYFQSRNGGVRYRTNGSAAGVPGVLPAPERLIRPAGAAPYRAVDPSPSRQHRRRIGCPQSHRSDRSALLPTMSAVNS